MTDPTDIERRDERSLVDVDAAIAVVTTTVGAMLGPAGAIAGALVGPYAKHAARRLIELRTRVEEAGIDTEVLAERLDGDEVLAQFVAEVVRGTVESDLAAKRGLLARAAIRVLDEDALVDVEAQIVGAAISVETVDVRVLALISDLQPPGPTSWHGRGRTDSVETAAIVERWPGVRPMVGAITAKLTSVGLILAFGTEDTVDRLPDFWQVTEFGIEFLSRLRDEGLDEEIAGRG